MRIIQMIKALEILAAGTHDANQDCIQDSIFVHAEETYKTKQDCIERLLVLLVHTRQKGEPTNQSCQ